MKLEKLVAVKLCWRCKMTERKKQYFSVLKKAKLFENLTDDDIYEIAQKMYYCEFEQDQVLVYEGEMGNELYIVVEGNVDVSVLGKENNTPQELSDLSDKLQDEQRDENILVAKIEAGDFFGEMSMLEQEPRSATCVASSTVKALVLKSKDFLGLIEKKPKVAGKILSNMLETTSKRLMSTNSFVTQIIQWGEAAKMRAIIDSLTGLFNRRYLDTHMPSILLDASAEKYKLCFAMVDIDHFGKLNQIYGTEFCDALLVKIAELFKSSFDKDDILFRYGGDEFCFFLRGEFSRALEQCEQLCKRLNNIRFTDHPELIPSCSIGLAHYENGISSENFLKLADAELYKAKAAGRNQVSSTF